MCVEVGDAEKSGLPSAVFGAGAVRFTLPSGRRGTPGVGRFSHCACAAEATSRIRTAIVVLMRTRNIHLSASKGSSWRDRSDRSDRSGRSCRSDRSAVVRSFCGERIERSECSGTNRTIDRSERAERSRRVRAIRVIDKNYFEKFFCARIKKYLIFRCDVGRFSDAARAGRRRASPLVLKCEADSFCDVRCVFERGCAECCGAKRRCRTGKEAQRFSIRKRWNVVVCEDAQAFSQAIA